MGIGQRPAITKFQRKIHIRAARRGSNDHRLSAMGDNQMRGLVNLLREPFDDRRGHTHEVPGTRRLHAEPEQLVRED